MSQLRVNVNDELKNGGGRDEDHTKEEEVVDSRSRVTYSPSDELSHLPVNDELKPLGEGEERDDVMMIILRRR